MAIIYYNSLEAFFSMLHEEGKRYTLQIPFSRLATTSNEIRLTKENARTQYFTSFSLFVPRTEKEAKPGKSLNRELR